MAKVSRREIVERVIIVFLLILGAGLMVFGLFRSLLFSDQADESSVLWITFGIVMLMLGLQVAKFLKKDFGARLRSAVTLVLGLYVALVLLQLALKQPDEKGILSGLSVEVIGAYITFFFVESISTTFNAKTESDKSGFIHEAALGLLIEKWTEKAQAERERAVSDRMGDEEKPLSFHVGQASGLTSASEDLKKILQGNQS